MNNELLEVALLGKAVGLKGALKLHNKSDFVHQYKKGAKFFLDNEVVIVKEFNKKNSTIVFEGYDNIDLAKTLTNKILYQDIQTTRQTCKLDKDEFFYFDVIGMNVFDNETLLGVVEDILEVGASYLFRIKTSNDFVSKNYSSAFYIPYNDVYVNKISLDEKKIYTQNAILLLENS